MKNTTHTTENRKRGLKKMSIKSYTKQARDRDCFMVHQKYINHNSSNENKDWKNLQ